MRNYSIYTLKTKLEFTNLYQYLSEKDYKQLEQQILCHSYALRLSFMQSLCYLIPNSSSAPSATLYMNTHSKYLLLPDTLSCKQIQCDI